MPPCLICSRPVRFDGRFGSWRRFCSRRCAGRWVAEHLKQRFTHEDRVRLGREGAAVKKAVYRDRMFADLATVPKDEAMLAAYKRGYNAGKRSRLKAAMRRTAAA